MKIYSFLKNIFVSLFYRDDKITFWNHNSNYYIWVEEQLKDKKKILDVGCGEGSLVKYLNNNKRYIVGIDISQKCIEKANQNNKKNDNIKFILTSFEKFESKNEYFDVIIFCATLHHMDMHTVLTKSKNLLNKKGILLIIGLYKPSSIYDWIIEILRVIPCFILSKIYNMKSSEDLDIPISYNIPKMSEIKENLNKIIPGYSISYGLYYRYLLKWIKNK